MGVSGYFSWRVVVIEQVQDCSAVIADEELSAGKVYGDGVEQCGVFGAEYICFA